jgi:hypothetical protein
VPSSVRYDQELLRTLYVTVYHLPDSSQDSFEATIPYSVPAILSVCLLVTTHFVFRLDFQHRSSVNSTTLASLLIPFVLGSGTLHSFSNIIHSTLPSRMPWRIMPRRQLFVAYYLSHRRSPPPILVCLPSFKDILFRLHSSMNSA